MAEKKADKKVEAGKKVEASKKVEVIALKEFKVDGETVKVGDAAKIDPSYVEALKLTGII